MNKLHIVIISLCYILFIHLEAQVVFWNEDFQNNCSSGCVANTYTGPNGSWTITNTGSNGSAANTWFISGAECGVNANTCGTSCGNADPSLHVGSTFFSYDPGAAYYAGGLFNNPTTNKRAESTVINCTGKNGITLSFNYIEYGETTNDNASLWYFDGSTWSQLVDLNKTMCCNGGGPVACTGFNQGYWTNFSMMLPISANNNPNVKIGFNWTNNNDASGSDPSFAVDDIELSWIAPLPIELLYFYGNIENEKVNLLWTTASETNNDYFVILKSFDGVFYKEIDKIKGAGNSTTYINYNYTDDLTGNHHKMIYYKLKQVDFDGKYTYSDVIVINTEIINENLTFYPNPTNSILNFNTSITNKNISLYDITGKNLTDFIMINENSIDLTKLSKGTYFIKIGEQIEKVLKF